MAGRKIQPDILDKAMVMHSFKHVVRQVTFSYEVINGFYLLT